MTITTIDDPDLIKKAYELKSSGMYVSDISKQLSEESGKRITQMALWRLFTNKTEKPLTNTERLDRLKIRLDAQEEELNRLRAEIEDLAAGQKRAVEEINKTLEKQ